MNNTGVLRIVAAGKNPVTEYVGKPDGVSKFSLDALKTPLSSEVPLDLAFRLASNELIKAAKKRAIVYISAGDFSLKDKFCASSKTITKGVSLLPNFVRLYHASHIMISVTTVCNSLSKPVS